MINYLRSQDIHIILERFNSNRLYNFKWIWFRKIDSNSKSMNEPNATVEPLSLTLACKEISEAKVNLRSFGFIQNQGINFVRTKLFHPKSWIIQNSPGTLVILTCVDDQRNLPSWRNFWFFVISQSVLSMEVVALLMS